VAVYVDDYRAPAEVNGISARWSHLLADTDTELVAFGRRLGLRPGWLQHAGQPTCHFDVTDGMREKAIRAGAQPISIRDSGEIVRRRRAALRTAAQETGTPAPAPPARRVAYNPTLRRHSWLKVREHVSRCRWCEIETVNQPDESSRSWFKTWTYPSGGHGTTYGGVKLPTCSGPLEAR
jgi:hypothetical protein